ncbi:MAG: hypothetical protein HC936_08160 [Leptolyngbyaceae cyanobacterium SU_3_3]|nr:hypothetical protein [Leptolyngbyaceae cyanobacterium SU_3_3]
MFTPSAQPEAEILEVYRTTDQFYQEANYREAHDRHCEWYRSCALQHQQELQKMRGDINLFKWFCRR